jgi:hypothetical protein
LAALRKPVWLEGNGTEWQGALAGAWIGAAVGRSVRIAADEEGACTAFEADFLCLMRSLGTDRVGLVCLHAPTALEPWQRAGAIRAAQGLLEDGLAEAFGLAMPRSAPALLANWRFDDAFDAVVGPCAAFSAEVASLARERRTTLVATDGECASAEVKIVRGPHP